MQEVLHPVTILKNVAAAGTIVALPTALVTKFIIQARPGNVGLVYVGGSNLVVASNIYGIALTAGQALGLTASHFGAGKSAFRLETIYLDAATNGDGVTVLYFEQVSPT